VNGSQLHATNTAIENLSTEVAAGQTHYYSVNDNGVQGGNYANDGATGANALAAGVDASASGQSSVAIGDGANASQANSVALGADSVTAAAVGTASGVINRTTYNYAGGAPVGVVSVGAPGAERQIQNVAAGQVSATSTDAVNGSQLYATNQAIESLASSIEVGGVKYYSVNSTGGGNEANDGATGADAIAAGKDASAAGDEAVAMGLGAQAAGEGSLAVGSGAQALSLNSLAIGSGAQASHANSIALGAGSATTVGAQSGYAAAYVGSSDSTGEVNVGGRTVTGVAPGIAGTDAVNVDQLKAGVDSANSYTDTQITTVNTRIDNLDNRVTTIEGDITDIKGDITNIQGDITNLDDRVTNVEGSVTEISNTVNQFDNRITNVENGSSGMFQVSQDHNTPPPRPTGTNSAAGGAGAVASGNNALAVGNDSQASGNNSTALGTGSKATGVGSTAVGQGANASHGNSVALGAGSATTVGAQSNYNAAYVGSSTSTGEVNVGGRTISGVAPGVAGTDAVNVNQLNGGVNYAINQANQYTDNRINQMQNDVWNIDRGYRGATASAMAMAGLPQAYLPGKSMLAVGFGGYQSEYGMAVGLSGITENGRYVYKAQASGNTVRDWGFSLGAGLQW
ncbi:YadA family autotransporter adhesin, partial [Luteimonas aquatica]|uniref:YadA family autotransporter adhesin n=1 Tax=Luteimonas aquatica TaxID=450364 RepID=UPI001F5A0E4A